MLLLSFTVSSRCAGLSTGSALATGEKGDD